MASIAEVGERQATIASYTAKNGRCSVIELAERFNVTPETIRRDLKALETQGFLHRVHGGAVSSEPAVNSDLLAVDDNDELPLHQSQRRKQAIAQKAAEFIPGPNSSIFVDAGSTTEAFSHVLANNYLGQNWSVVTNSPNVAATLATAGVSQVHMIGGIVKARTQAVVGSSAVDEINALRTDVAFLGTSGLSVERGLTTSDQREATIKRAVMEISKTCVVLCDSAKIGRESMVSFAPLSRVDVIVTDRFIPEPLRDSLSLVSKLVIP